MHPEMMQELNELHIQELRCEAARRRSTHPRNSIRRVKGRAKRPAAVAQSNRSRETWTHA